MAHAHRQKPDGRRLASLACQVGQFGLSKIAGSLAVALEPAFFTQVSLGLADLAYDEVPGGGRRSRQTRRDHPEVHRPVVLSPRKRVEMTSRLSAFVAFWRAIARQDGCISHPPRLLGSDRVAPQRDPCRPAPPYCGEHKNTFSGHISPYQEQRVLGVIGLSWKPIRPTTGGISNTPLLLRHI